MNRRDVVAVPAVRQAEPAWLSVLLLLLCAAGLAGILAISHRDLWVAPGSLATSCPPWVIPDRHPAAAAR